MIEKLTVRKRKITERMPRRFGQRREQSEALPQVQQSSPSAVQAGGQTREQHPVAQQ